MGHNWLGPAFSGGDSGTQYHGSEANLRPGDKITPGRSNIRGRASDSGGYVHSTPSQAAARAFAGFKSGGKGASTRSSTRDRRKATPTTRVTPPMRVPGRAGPVVRCASSAR